MRRVLKSVTAAMLVMVLLVSCVISASASEWDYTYLEASTTVPVSQSFTYTVQIWPSYPEGDFVLAQTIEVDAGNYMHCHYIRDNATQKLIPAYCFDPRRESVDGLYFTQGGMGNYAGKAWDDLTARYPMQTTLVSRVVGITNSLASGLSRPEKDVAMVAGQSIIREIFCEYRVTSKGTLSEECKTAGGSPFYLYVDQNRATNYHKYYNTIANALTSFNTLPQFMSADPTKAPTTELQWNAETAQYEATIVDEAGHISNMGKIVIPGVSVSKDGNTLYLSSKTPIVEPVTSNVVVKNQSYCDAAGGSYVVWGAANGDRTQAVVTQTDIDPVNAYMKVTTGEVPTILIDGYKVWDDGANQDGLQPENITVHLNANGVIIDSITFSGADGWRFSFGERPMYDEDGKEIIYTLTEDEVPGYTTKIDGYVVTNTHTPETVDIEGQKHWDDNDNQDGYQPSDIVLFLLADGEKVAETTTNAEKEWKYGFYGMPKYKNGVEIKYSILEDEVEHYTPSYSEDNYDVTNTHVPETVTLEGEKIWDDYDNQDGIRPDVFTLHVIADGEDVMQIEVRPDGNGKWAWCIEGLPKYKDGVEIKYELVEDPIPGYTATYAPDFATITNTHTPEVVYLHGTKYWDDANDVDGLRPPSVAIRLHADGEEIAVFELSEATNWEWASEALPKYKDGKEIVYTISEDRVAYYTTVIDGYDVINSHTPEIPGIPTSPQTGDPFNSSPLMMLTIACAAILTSIVMGIKGRKAHNC